MFCILTWFCLFSYGESILKEMKDGGLITVALNNKTTNGSPDETNDNILNKRQVFEGEDCIHPGPDPPYRTICCEDGGEYCSTNPVHSFDEDCHHQNHHHEHCVHHQHHHHHYVHHDMYHHHLHNVRHHHDHCVHHLHHHEDEPCHHDCCNDCCNHFEHCQCCAHPHHIQCCDPPYHIHCCDPPHHGHFCGCDMHHHHDCCEHPVHHECCCQPEQVQYCDQPHHIKCCDPPAHVQCCGQPGLACWEYPMPPESCEHQGLVFIGPHPCHG